MQIFVYFKTILADHTKYLQSLNTYW